MAIERFYGSLGRNVREWRRRRHLTQAQIGARLQPPVTRASIANLELGKQRVLAHTLAQLAAALDVDLADLLPTARHERSRWRLLEDELRNALHLPPARAAQLVRRLGASE